MDAPLGSVASAADELRRLQRRAYGPAADIAADAAAQARLAELEACQRGPAAVVDTVPGVSDPALESVAAPDPLAEPDEPRARSDTADAPPQPAAAHSDPRSSRRRRVRRILPWGIAAVATLVAAVATGALIVDASNDLHPVARLTPQANPSPEVIPVDEDVVSGWNLTRADFVFYGSYGAIDIWSTTIPGPKRCIAAVVSGSTWRFECTATTIDTIIDIDIEPGNVPPAPSGEPASNVRFVLHDDVVDVYLPPHPDGGYYP